MCTIWLFPTILSRLPFPQNPSANKSAHTVRWACSNTDTDSFAPSGPFTNALLHNHEITALIRDTEPHERGLFSVDHAIGQNGTKKADNTHSNDGNARRKTGQGAVHAQSSTVARVLGPEMLRKIQSSTQEGGRGRKIDLETLLQGAEKLCSAYDVSGTKDRIDAIRTRHQSLITSIASYEQKLSRQHPRGPRAGADETVSGISASDMSHTAEADPSSNEEDTLQTLEERKKTLESRIAAMERDLGGLRG